MDVLTSVLGFLFAAPSMTDRMFDDTFSGIYRLSFFDWSLLVPYFGMLAVLSVYGLHRYETIRRYIKHRRKLPRSAPQKFEHLPAVTIQLPITSGS